MEIKNLKKTKEDNCSNCDSISKTASDAIKAAVMPSVEQLSHKDMPTPPTFESVLSDLKEPITIDGKVIFDPKNPKQKVDTQFLDKFVNNLEDKPVKFKDSCSDKYTDCMVKKYPGGEKYSGGYMLSFKTVTDSVNSEPKEYCLWFEPNSGLKTAVVRSEFSFQLKNGKSEEMYKRVCARDNGQYSVRYNVYSEVGDLEMGVGKEKNPVDGTIKSYKYFNPCTDYSMFEYREDYHGKIDDESVTQFIKNYIDDHNYEL